MSDPEKELPWVYYVELDGGAVRTWLLQRFKPWLADNYNITELAPKKEGGYILKFERRIFSTNHNKPEVL